MADKAVKQGKKFDVVLFDGKEITNKLSLFNTLDEIAKKGKFLKVNFLGDFDEKYKSFKYSNLTAIIRTIPENAVFTVEMKKGDEVKTYDITLKDKKDKFEKVSKPRVIFTVTRLNGDDSNTVRGSYTNKKMLFDTLEKAIEKHGYDEATFMDIFSYVDKRFNYSNLTSILRSLNYGEALSLKLEKTQTDETVTIQISVNLENEPNLKLS